MAHGENWEVEAAVNDLLASVGAIELGLNNRGVSEGEPITAKAHYSRSIKSDTLTMLERSKLIEAGRTMAVPRQAQTNLTPHGRLTQGKEILKVVPLLTSRILTAYGKDDRYPRCFDDWAQVWFRDTEDEYARLEDSERLSTSSSSRCGTWLTSAGGWWSWGHGGASPQSYCRSTP